VASRRHAEELISAGRVTVNGVVVRELGTKADPARDAVALDGQRVVTQGPRRAIVLHKPRGVVSTLKDPEGRASLRHLLSGPLAGLFPVGRLDLQTSGLLLLTNDGALAYGLLHPKQGVERVYRVKVRGTPTAAAMERLTRGVRLGRTTATVAAGRIVERLPTKSWLEITVCEGRWHLVRRICDAIGHPVEKLERIRFGPLRLGPLPPGGWRDVTPRELVVLRQAAGLAPGGAGAPAPPRRGRGTRPRTPRPRAAASRPAESRSSRPAPPGGGARATRPRRPTPQP
jgi:23S rRNA pseudouridine2605 synthase